MSEPTKKEILDELRREVAMREKVYPRWVQSGKIHPKIAANRIACLKAACSDFQQRHFGTQESLSL